jgi:hypothetical protein
MMRHFDLFSDEYFDDVFNHSAAVPYSQPSTKRHLALLHRIPRIGQKLAARKQAPASKVIS